jgi:hypothetical protein
LSPYRTHAPIVQLAETRDLKSLRCGFESHLGHSLLKGEDYDLEHLRNDWDNFSCIVGRIGDLGNH